METTLEVRWFVKGMLPTLVQRWFRLECPGKFITKSEVRKDWYGDRKKNNRFTLKNILSHEVAPQEASLKFRQGNLELKLRNQEFGIHRLTQINDLSACEGRVEQWCKYEWIELTDFVSVQDSFDDTSLIGVEKKREQKIDWGVNSELTRLKIDRQSWVTIAFEMNQNNLNRQQYSHFKKLVQKALQTYCGSKLSANNCYVYSRCLLEFAPQTLPYRQTDIGIRLCYE